MSDNGPYTQPPQYPGGEGNNSGGQQPYGGYGQPGPGDPNAQQPGGYGPPGGGYPTGGQQGYPGGQPDYQQGAYGTGPQYPDQGMYQGGGGGPQPPFGGTPGGYPPPKKSSAGLWIVIAGGAVILVLVVAVVVMLLRNTGEEPTTTAGGGGGGDTQTGEGGGDTEGDSGGEGKPQGEAPYALPEDACKMLSESQMADYGIEDKGSKTLSDTSSTCSWSTTTDDGSYGYLSINYDVPYGGSDSVEGAKTDYSEAVKSATDKNPSYGDRTIVKSEDYDLGQEGTLVLAEDKTVSTTSVGTLLIRQDNINISIEHRVSASVLEDNPPAPLKFSDVEKTLPGLGEIALDHLGAS